MGGILASPPGSGGGIVYGPRNLEDKFKFYIGEMDDETRRVLGKIDKIYSRSKKLLDNESVIDNNAYAFCFGLLDPASNVIVNSVISKSKSAPAAARKAEGEQVDADTMRTRRSLAGLVAFLTTLFRYLPVAEATAYLDAAGADPLVAALLIIYRRGMRGFDFSSGATAAAVETALRCAAAAARHPDPRRLVLGWKLLSPHLKNLASELSRSRATPDASVQRMLMLAASKDTETPPPYLHLDQSWELASSRRVRRRRSIPPNKALPPARGAMKRMLLATIHGFYVQALARLPTAEVRARYHRSMIEGGNCYGPLSPVSNIIVNTLWYEHNFPVTSSEQVTLRMISTACLRRAAARSLYGLVSFLCTRYPSLTPDQALQRLLIAGADLRVADPNLFDLTTRTDKKKKLSCSGNFFLPVGWCRSRPSASAVEAYASAAAAAFHRDPAAQQQLLGSPDSVSRLKTETETLLQDDRPLSSELLVHLSKTLLLHCPSSAQKQEQPPRTKVRRGYYAHNSECQTTFWGQHGRVCRKVNAALDSYNKGWVPHFRLHIICGVNELVSGPEFSIDPEVKGYNPWTPFKYHHCHINFLATCGDLQSAEGAPLQVLFFAECSNHGIHKESWCVPVTPPRHDAGQVRCIYCEHEVSMIVHPAMKSFHGRDIEFENVSSGEGLFHDSEHYTNDHIITDNRIYIDWVYGLGDDAIYSICNPDDIDVDDKEEVELRVC